MKIKDLHFLKYTINKTTLLLIILLIAFCSNFSSNAPNIISLDNQNDCPPAPDYSANLSYSQILDENNKGFPNVNNALMTNGENEVVNSSIPTDSMNISQLGETVENSLPNSSYLIDTPGTTEFVSSPPLGPKLPIQSASTSSHIHSDLHTLTPSSKVFTKTFSVTAERFLAIDGSSLSSISQVKYYVTDPSLTLVHEFITLRTNPSHYFVFAPTDGTWNVTLELIGTGDTNATLMISTETSGSITIDKDTPHHYAYGYMETGTAEYFLIDSRQSNPSVFDYFTCSFSSVYMRIEIYDESNVLRYNSGSGTDFGYCSRILTDDWVVVLYNSRGDDVLRSLTIPRAYIANLSPASSVFMEKEESYLIEYEIESRMSILSLDISDATWISIIAGSYNSYIQIWGVFDNGTILFSGELRYDFKYTTQLAIPVSSLTIILVGDASKSNVISLETSESTFDRKSFGDRFNIDFSNPSQSYYFVIEDVNTVNWALLHASSSTSHALYIQICDFSNPTHVLRYFSASSDDSNYYIEDFITQTDWLVIVWTRYIQMGTIELTSNIESNPITDNQIQIDFNTAGIVSYSLVPSSSNAIIGMVNRNSFDTEILLINSSGDVIDSSYLSSTRSRFVHFFQMSDFNDLFFLIVLGEINARILGDIRKSGNSDMEITAGETIYPRSVVDEELVYLSYSKISNTPAILSMTSNESIYVTLLAYNENNYVNSLLVESSQTQYIILDGTIGNLYKFIFIGNEDDKASFTITEKNSFEKKSIPHRMNYFLVQHGSILAIYFEGPANDLNTSILAIGLNSGYRTRMLYWNGTSSGSFHTYLFRSGYNSQYFAFSSNSQWQQVYLLFFGTPNQNLTISFLNTGSPANEIEDINKFHPIHHGGLELWHIGNISTLLSITAYSEYSYASMSLLISNSTSFLDIITLLSSSSTSSKATSKIIDLCDNGDLYVFIYSQKQAYPIYWSTTEISQIGNISQQYSLFHEARGSSHAVAYNLNEYAGKLEFNITLLTSKLLFIYIYNPNLVLQYFNYISSIYSDYKVSFNIPQIGVYYIVLVANDPLNSTIDSGTKEAELIELEVQLEILSPSPSNLIMKNGTSSIEPRYNGSITINVNITYFPGSYVSQILFSYTNGSSWMEMSYTGEGDIYTISWNSLSVPDGFVSILIYVMDSSGYVGFRSLTIYVDNIQLPGEIDFYYDDDPPSIQLLNYKHNDYVRMGTLWLQLWISDASGVACVERSQDLITWYELEPNASGHYNHNWIVDIGYDNILYIRTNDTRNNTGTLTLSVIDLEEDLYNGQIRLYIDEIAPKVVEDSFYINLLEINESYISLNITYDLFDHAGIKSVLSYYDTTYSYDGSARFTVFNRSYHNRVVNQTICHSITRKAIDERAELIVNTIDSLGNEIFLKASIIIEVGKPIFFTSRAQMYNDEVYLLITDARQKIFTINDYGSGIKEIYVEDLTNDRIFNILSVHSSEYDFTDYSSCFDGGQIARYSPYSEYNVYSRFFGHSTMKELDRIKINAIDFVGNEMTIEVRIDYQVPDPPNPSGFLFILFLTITIGGIIYWKRDLIKEKLQPYVDYYSSPATEGSTVQNMQGKPLPPPQKRVVQPPTPRECANCGKVIGTGLLCKECRYDPNIDVDKVIETKKIENASIQSGFTTCSNCGQKVVTGAFCRNCGAKL